MVNVEKSVTKNVTRGIQIETFIPYELEDLGVIIPHSSLLPNRWQWFWPRYKAITPPEVLKNTVVIYHHQGDEMPEIPDDVREVEEFGVLDCVMTHDKDLTEATLRGLEHCRTRLIARIQDDTGMDDNWAQRVIDAFNKPPHIKLMGQVVALGPLYDRIKDSCAASWYHKLLHHGDYNWIAFICGNAIATNRSVWKGYYPLVAEVNRFDYEDFYFTLFCMADGIQMEKSVPWSHCGGKRGLDEISKGCQERFQL